MSNNHYVSDITLVKKNRHQRRADEVSKKRLKRNSLSINEDGIVELDIPDHLRLASEEVIYAWATEEVAKHGIKPEHIAGGTIEQQDCLRITAEGMRVREMIRAEQAEGRNGGGAAR